MPLARSTFRVKKLQPELVEVEGKFFPKGTTTPDNTANEGVGWQVSRTGVGTFLITLKDSYSALIGYHGSVQLTAAAQMGVQFGDYTAPTATTRATLVLRTQAGATPTDISTGANNSVSFKLTFRNTSIKPTKGY